MIVEMRPGSKPKGKVMLEWSSDFAYAIGLLTADGCLSKNGRHIDFTSKDRAQVALFRKSLGIVDAKIGTKRSGIGSLAYRIQFGDVLFYNFLLGIGLSPAKSKILTSVSIPDEYFPDFIRGLFDGDGCSYSFYDSVFKKSFRFYITFASASPKFLYWLQEKLFEHAEIRGAVSKERRGTCTELKYSKREAVILSEKMYYRSDLPCLKRKYLKIQKSMNIISKSRGGEIGKHAAFRSQ